MTWRDLFALGAITVLVSAIPAAFAQSPERVYRLGMLSPSSGTIERLRAGVVPELARLGFIEGRNLVFEARFGTTEHLPALARELASMHPDVVMATGGPAIRAIRQAAGATPIVGSFIGEDPIKADFATSLGHPGGTITGIVMLATELERKRLQLLHETVPGVHRVAALVANAQGPNLPAAKEAADLLGVELLPFFAEMPDDYQAAFAAMRRSEAGALQILSSPQFFSDAPSLAALALESKLPTVCEWAEMARSGCLLGYGPDFTELRDRLAGYVAQIFRGASPGELPIEEPTHYAFAINLKTAKVLGLTIPSYMLARADEVIE
jgi:putative tryptophan/tyrosine transport system substrate-binding protein